MIHVALTRWRKQNSSLKSCDVLIVFSQGWTFRPCDGARALCRNNRPAAQLSAALTMLQSINAWLIGQHCKVGPLSPPREHAPDFSPFPRSPEVGSTISTGKGRNDMAKKRKAKKSKPKRTAKKIKPQKSKSKRPKKPPTSNVDVLTPVASDEALERSALFPATVACTARHCL